jgi:hypothetical protein
MSVHGLLSALELSFELVLVYNHSQGFAVEYLVDFISTFVTCMVSLNFKSSQEKELVPLAI